MRYSPNPDLAAFVQCLPKTETHLHLEGALPFSLLQAAYPGKYLEEPAFWSPDFRYGSFAEFMEMFATYGRSFFTNPDRYHEAAKIVLKTCVDQNVRYVETSVHMPAIANYDGDPKAAIDAILDAAPPGLEVRVFVGINHDSYTTGCGPVIDDCLSWERLAGIDLHGPEDAPLEPWTAEIWEAARAAGKATKAHAGEFMGADFVARILDELGVKRIEHGVRSVEDEAVVRRLVADGVTLDVCPISNVKLQVKGVTSMAAHPIRQLFDAGVRVTVNSDDPFFFGNSLSDDYFALAMDLGFTERELIKVARNGFEVALNADAVASEATAEFDRIAAEVSS